MSKEANYIYGVIKGAEQKSFGALEEGPEIYTVSAGNLSAVVSDQPATDYSSLSKPELIKELAGHQGVIEHVMKEHTIVPFKFGTYIPGGNAEVIAVLKKGHDELKRELETIEGKIELDLVALWNTDLVVRDVYHENPEVPELQKKISAKSGLDVLESKVVLGRLVASAISEKQTQYATEISADMKKFCFDWQEHALISENMVVNLAFLLQSENEAEFQEAVRRLDWKFNGRMNFRCVGPLPSYSFSTFEVKIISGAAIEEAKEILGVSQAEGIGQIKQAFRELTKEFHPDRSGGGADAEERYKRIANAHELLSECYQNGWAGVVGDFIAVKAFRSGVKADRRH